MANAGISIHAVDIASGLPAVGMTVSLAMISSSGRGSLIDQSPLDSHGMISVVGRASKPFAKGTYEAVFHIGDYYRDLGWTLPDVPFVDVFPFTFQIFDASRHYHLPLKFTPWGTSLFLTV